jgi:hypothetical protein
MIFPVNWVSGFDQFHLALSYCSYLCQKDITMEKNTITRQELYDLVWKESLTSISKRLNTPFLHLRKICSEMDVPIPPNGHWSKIQFGKSVEIIKLPQDYQGENEIKLFPAEDDITHPKVITFYQKSTLELIKKDKTLPLKITKKLFNPDQIITSAENCLTKHPLARWNNREMVRITIGHINIRVAPASINRALRFIDAFIKLLKARGHGVITEYSFAQAVINDVKFKFSLNEKSRQKTIDNSMINIEDKPTGKLTFTIESRKNKSWSDVQAPIEEKLAEILAHLETQANIANEERLF